MYFILFLLLRLPEGLLLALSSGMILGWDVKVFAFI